VEIVTDLLPSECYSSRPLEPRYIVLHATAGGSYAGAKAAYIARRVSAHFTVEKSGKVWQNVPLKVCAHHAGASVWQNVRWLNWSSLGIEMVNRNIPVNETLTTAPEEYPLAQVEAVTELVLMLAKQFNLDWQAVLTHAMISPGRKSDPAGFHQYFDILEAVRKQGAGNSSYDRKVLIPKSDGSGWANIEGQRWENNALVINATDPDRVFIRGK
jgi:N-acetyl-anhydromuramyl-L-alanine amidase AmpD